MYTRAAKPADSSAISHIARTTFVLACPPTTPADELKRYIDENLSNTSFDTILRAGECHVRVLEDDGTVIGFSLVNPTPEPTGLLVADGLPELSRCYVRSDYHGLGAAQTLLEATLANLSTPIRLMVNDQNARAIRFYERNGFASVGTTNFQCGDDTHRDLIMVRPVI